MLRQLARDYQELADSQRELKNIQLDKLRDKEGLGADARGLTAPISLEKILRDVFGRPSHLATEEELREYERRKRVGIKKKDFITLIQMESGRMTNQDIERAMSIVATAGDSITEREALRSPRIGASEVGAVAELPETPRSLIPLVGEESESFRPLVPGDAGPAEIPFVKKKVENIEIPVVVKKTRLTEDEQIAFNEALELAVSGIESIVLNDDRFKAKGQSKENAKANLISYLNDKMQIRSKANEALFFSLRRKLAAGPKIKSDFKDEALREVGLIGTLKPKTVGSGIKKTKNRKR